MSIRLSSVRHRWLIAGTALALTIAMAAVAPAAQARGANPVVKSWKTAPGFYMLAQGMNSIWAVNGDEQTNATLYRINPGANVMSKVTRLPFPAGGIVVTAGSVWIADYYGNSVYRLAPSGKVQARISVGLQPQWMHVAFGSVWVSDHHSAEVTRIDPATNSPIAQIPVGDQTRFRNGPQAITDDGSRLYVASSNLPFLQAIDPTTNVVTDLAGPSDDAFCGSLTYAGGHIWNPDGCTGATYLLNTDGTTADAIDQAPGVANDAAVLGTHIWLSVDSSVDPGTGMGSGGELQERNPATGSLLATLSLGGDLQSIVSGFGDLWVFDAGAGKILRVHP